MNLVGVTVLDRSYTYTLSFFAYLCVGCHMDRGDYIGHDYLR